MVSTQEAGAFGAVLIPRGEDIPKAQGLIACSGHYGGAIRGHGQIEHSIGVTSEGGHLFHLRVLPNIYLVVRVTMRRHDLVQTLAEHQVAHLRSDIDCF